MGFIQPGKSLKRKKIKGTQKKKKPKIPKIPAELIDIVEPKKSILERFPRNVVFKIFLYTGIEENNLSLTNKYFNLLFKFSSKLENSANWSNISLINGFIDNHYISDLNQNINIKKMEAKRAYYVKSFPPSLENENLIKLIECIEIFKKFHYGLSNKFFQYKFVNNDIISHIYDMKVKVLQDDQIAEEIAERPKYLKSILKSLSSDLKKLRERQEEYDGNLPQERFNEPLEDDEENTESRERLVELDSSEEYSYRTHLKKPDYPRTFYLNGINTKEKLNIAISLNLKFSFVFTQLNLIMKSTVTNFDVESDLSILEVITFIIANNQSKEKISAEAIIEIFKLFKRFKEENNVKVLDDLTKCIDMLLSMFYSNDNAKKHDNDLWTYIVNEKNFELFQILMKYNDSPNNQVLLLLESGSSL